MRKADFIGIGAQKCATSWIYNALKEHPDVFVSNPKELDFFSFHYNFGLFWYEQHFADAGNAGAVGEISPSYLCDLSAPARAYEYSPLLKIIVALREPVERAYSNHLHEVRSGRVPSSAIDFRSGLGNNPMYLEQSRYHKYLQHWYAAFPHDQIFCVFQEDVCRNPMAELQRLYRFLGVDECHIPAARNRRANESRVIRFRALGLLTWSVRKLLLLLGLQGPVRYLQRSGPVAALRRINSRDLREVVPPMDDEVRHWCGRQLEEDTEQLRTLLEIPRFPWENHTLDDESGT